MTPDTAEPSVSAVLASATEQLRRIADALELVIHPPAVEDGPCLHPAEARIDFSASGVEEYECRLCGAHVSRRIGRGVTAP